MLRCTKCGHEAPRKEFESSSEYVCPKCGMDESGIVAYCEICGTESDDTTLSDSETVHTNPLCFK